MLDPATEATVAALSDHIYQAFGDELLSLALFGSAAGEDFVAGESDINLAIVLRSIGLLQLDTFQRELPDWRRRGAATPILLDPDYLEHAADVFPMEIQDIVVRHRVLRGRDLFAEIRIDPQHLRFQLEQEARSKLLRLRLAYIEGDGSDEHLEGLMLQSVKAFMSIVRSLARWHEPTLALTDPEMLAHFCQRFDLPLPTLTRLIQIRRHADTWWAPRKRVFSDYLVEVERLAHLVDKLDLRA